MRNGCASSGRGRPTAAHPQGPAWSAARLRTPADRRQEGSTGTARPSGTQASVGGPSSVPSNHSWDPGPMNGVPARLSAPERGTDRAHLALGNSGGDRNGASGQPKRMVEADLSGRGGRARDQRVLQQYRDPVPRIPANYPGPGRPVDALSLIPISEPTRLGMSSYA